MDKYWMNEPEEHDFAAAIDYLELLYEPEEAKLMAKELQAAKTVVKKSKDILRASRLPLLPSDNVHVKENLKKIKRGKLLSPILLVRNKKRLVIADGYHRVCAIYYLSEDLVVPCRLI